MRAGLLALSATLLLTACGDDGKVGRQGAPGGPASAKQKEATTPWDSSPTVVQERSNLTSWARTRPGDTATWEIRLKDSPLVTRLTWKAVAVEDGIVRYEVESVTTDATGRTVSSASSRDERHPTGGEAPLPKGLETPFEAGEVGGKRIRQVRQAGPRVDGMILTVSDQVPFGGLVRHRNAGVDQMLVDFTQAP